MIIRPKICILCAALALAGAAMAQTNRNAHQSGLQGWTSADATRAAQTIESHAKDLGLTHSQLMTIHAINLRLSSRRQTSEPPRPKVKRILAGTPMDAGTQALQQIQRVLTMHQREKVVQSGWLDN